MIKTLSNLLIISNTYALQNIRKHKQANKLTLYIL